MEPHKILPAEYDILEQQMKNALPLSICAFVHFKLMRTRNLIERKNILVNSWPEPSVVVIVDNKDWGILPSAVSFCKGPEFVRSLKALLQLASKNVPSPILVVGCSTDVINALVNLYECKTSCPFKPAQENSRVYTLPPKNVSPPTIPDGFRVSELGERHIDPVKKSWRYSEEYEQFFSMDRWLRYHFSNFTTMCIETEDGVPVAWELQQDYGAVGMLHVVPEFRRKKLGSVVTMALAEKMNNEGQMIFACVNENNETGKTSRDQWIYTSGL
uniref:Glycine N-acyltransferase-like protein n=1 Tax=Crassostrea virginica TaxID=6565 RepID=A0A8B8AM31_CRAVI|nr:glycine N-acyltransferase-like protein 3 isoform X1 [Crassostrea virginica]